MPFYPDSAIGQRVGESRKPRSISTMFCPVSTYRPRRSDGANFVGLNAVAVEEIKNTRWKIRENPFLLTRETIQTEPTTENARRERKRRIKSRELLADLSRYYPRGKRKNAWTGPTLLAACKHKSINTLATFHLPMFSQWCRTLRIPPKARSVPTNCLARLRRQKRWW